MTAPIAAQGSCDESMCCTEKDANIDLGTGCRRMKLFDSRWDGYHGIGRFSVELFSRLNGFQRVQIRGKPTDPIDPWRLGYYLRRVNPVLYFSPGYNAPIGAVGKFALTVYDLNHLRVKENSSNLIRIYYARILRPAVRRADVVFTSSEFSKGEILEWSGINAHKLVTLKPGISESLSQNGAKFKSARPYFLYVGNHSSHKNLEGAFRGFALSKLHHSHYFLVTGLPSKKMRVLLNRLSILDDVKFLGRVTDSDLAALYRGATAAVLVSFYEGFGMPIIESMACGTPVLTSNVASMPEAAGGAAVLVNPYSVEEIADGMRKLACDDDLRRVLTKRGLEWSSRYCWDATARKVGHALEEMV